MSYSPWLISLLYSITVAASFRIKSFRSRYGTTKSPLAMGFPEVVEAKSVLQFFHDLRCAAVSTSEKDLISTSLAESFGNFMSLKLNSGKKMHKINNVSLVTNVNIEEKLSLIHI